MKRTDTAGVWLAVLIGVAGYFCLIRWAECPQNDRACFVYGPN